MKRLRLVSLLTALFIVAGLAVACKPTPTPTEAPPPTEAPTEEVTEAPTEAPTEVEVEPLIIGTTDSRVWRRVTTSAMTGWSTPSTCARASSSPMAPPSTPTRSSGPSTA